MKVKGVAKKTKNNKAIAILSKLMSIRMDQLVHSIPMGYRFIYELTEPQQANSI